MKWRGAAIGGGATSGKLGPAVASRNKGGQYLRSRVVPSGGTPTPQQEVIRNAIRSVVPSWSSLTPDQRAGWNTFGTNVPTVDVLGDTIQLSGQNWYVGANVLATQIGTPLFEDAPTTFDRGGIDLSAASFTAGASSGTLSMGAPLNTLFGGDSTGTMNIYLGRDFSAGRSKYFGSFQYTNTYGSNRTNPSFEFTLPFAHSSSNQLAMNIVIQRGDGRYTTPSRLTVSP